MNKHLCLCLLLFSFFYKTQGYAQHAPELYPVPKLVATGKTNGLSLSAINHLDQFVLPLSTLLQREMEAKWVLDPEKAEDYLVLVVEKDPEIPEQGYHLHIKNDTISIKSADRPGIYYALQTLKQLSLSPGNWLQNELKIEDHPDFNRRGYMLDISRDKVPTMASIYNLIDLLSFLKYNEFQLYTEHTFAYKDHQEVWKDASPMTAEQIKKIDTYCKQRNIDLVPNQNSFGHMERWLEHDAYLHLAECPEDCNTIWGLRKRHSLDPTNPETLQLMQSLYEELLPNFSSNYFNIGCDETIELGLGRSAEASRKEGKGRVYLEYLLKLHREASRHGKKVQFWGDIILNHPDLIDELPSDITALVWGYGSDYPFREHLPKFKQAGIPFYVSPGTSSWRSLIGRNTNGFENLKNAAVNGYDNQASGYLLTDWGDHGHWQPQVISTPAIVLASALSWNTKVAPVQGLASWMDRHIFKDSTQHFSAALLKLGDAYTATGIPEGNANIFHQMLRRFAWTLKGQYQTREMTVKGLEKAEAEIVGALQLLERSAPTTTDALLLKQELEQAAALARHGIKLGKARLSAPGGEVKNISLAHRKELASELEQLIATHKELWLKRNREGGLKDSAEKLEEIRSYYLEE